MSLASRLFAVLFVSGIAFAGAAEARDASFTARLASPVTERIEFIAQNALWTCEGEECRAVVNHGVSVRACRQLAREAGAIAAYGDSEVQLTEEELARCNTAVRGAGQQASN